MSEKRRGLGRGLGALIPTSLDGARSTRERPVDVFFPDARPQAAADGPNETVVATIDPDDVAMDSDTLGTASDSAVSATEAPVSDAPEAAPVSADDATPPNPEDDDRDPAGAATEPDGPSTAAAFDGLHGELSAVPAPRASGEPASDSAREGTELVPVPGAVFAELPLDEIRPNPRQPRTVFDEDALDELVGSIREIGVLQPVVVRRAGDGYELIMGERRWRAAGAAGLDAIPAIIRETGDEDLLRDALLENLHRSQLNPLEEAAAYQQLLDDFGCTHDELASRLHRSRPQISNTLRLLKLPPLVQRRVAAGVLSAGHARALLGLADGGAIERLAQRIVAEGLSVRAVEEIVALGGDGLVAKRRAAPRAGVRNEALDALATRLSDRFETRVKVALGKSRGRLTVEFASVQDLNRILNTLAPEDPGLFHG
ncbi:MAG: chromosome partitioning protein ParB [Cellulomonas sp. 73-145]|uniref:ParB/RepB/Spo0J family partition protein n=1 Tax=Cellulomonas sp. 73-145 TaxID=1895739 RepID=UPI0009265E80|nr:ParB/RepB/Spo0J family partition protein [Cellulomonas sp. 73-145]OJV58734.1 MAG: chromosome partitioning protein ParB [Cellulomonas sp. 73-145]